MRSSFSTFSENKPAHGQLGDDVLQSAKESWIADTLQGEDDGSMLPVFSAHRSQGEGGDEQADRSMLWHRSTDFIITPLKRQVEARPYTAVILAAVAGGVIAAMLRAGGKRLGGLRAVGVTRVRRRSR